MPPELTVVGSINVDMVARVDRLPRPGETVTDAILEYHQGGKGANQAVAAARLGARVRMNGCVGSDRFGTPTVEKLKKAGVDTSPVFHVGGDTGLALIAVSSSSENQIIVVPGANAHLSPDDLDFEKGTAVLCQLEIPAETVAAAAGRAGFFCLNAAPSKPIPAEVVRAADLVVVNRYELEALPETARLTALTLGAEGAVLLEHGEEVARAAAPRVEAVDGTAAGDAFTACLVVSLLEGRPREAALERACKAGALAATKPGAQPSLPTAREVDELR